MNLTKNPELLDQIAAAHALGTLRGGARRRFEGMARENPGVRSRALLWQETFTAFTEVQPAMVPSPQVWQRIENLLPAVRRPAAVVAPAPYDLVIANILAGPLVSMAPELAAIAAPGATIVLAGLLETQRAQVVAAYAACGCSLVEVDRRGDWSVLRLTAGAARFVPSEPFDPKGRDGWALDL